MAATGDAQSTTDLALSKTVDQIWANRGNMWQLSTSCHVVVAFIIQYYILWNGIYHFKVQFDILVKKKKKYFLVVPISSLVQPTSVTVRKGNQWQEDMLYTIVCTIQVQEYQLKTPFKCAVEETTLKYDLSFQTPRPSSNHQHRIHLLSFSFHHKTTLHPTVLTAFLVT